MKKGSRMEPADREYLKELGGRINQVAELYGSKRKMGEAIGIFAQNLHLYIRGERAARITMLKKIADKTGVDFGWLVTGDGDMKGWELRKQIEEKNEPPVPSPRPIHMSKMMEIADRADAILDEMDPKPDIRHIIKAIVMTYNESLNTNGVNYENFKYYVS